ncbi:lysM and putative peptidoglycan-binding domain-containing protein 3 [Latimeria chalumnae]|uniref:LysM and putative peptidoglycan-binding domain-containing protein 3 n=1 Tax=Latimeria chalumnae TaxID=7897 RepID=H3AER9_LATCH|nr:PREDICTED: lysM and putative peptidoglycan-binding domain-containing protein 3 [Latimeria chalumnae]|eukprot:XP_006005116.1 PREDICTED: lysM and putative peptidoglycan-binding domain-containing protein 3 [Latimeria chalumnae]
MPGKSPPRAKQSAVVAQPVLLNHAGVFGNNKNSENDSPEEDADRYELRPRGREKVRRSVSRDRLDDIVYITREIQEGDTLAGISLQYCCSVADIKRVNSLINDQDFFALRSVKIPVKKFSILTETHSPSKIKQTPRPSLAQHNQEIQQAPSEAGSSSESAGNFLQEVDKDIEEIVKSTDNTRENLNEVVSSFSTQQLYLEVDHKPVKRKDPYYGADWGIGWWAAVVIMVVVGIVTPIFYLLYYEVLIKADVSHHSTAESGYHNVAVSHQHLNMANPIGKPLR